MDSPPSPPGAAAPPEKRSLTLSADDLRAILARKDDVIADLERRLSDRDRTHQELQFVVETLRARIGQTGATDARQRDLRERLEACERALGEIERSLSWKITAPLRRIRRLFRRGAPPPPRRATFVPAADLAPAAGDRPEEWDCTGNDPQFSIHGPWPSGHVRVRVHVDTQGVPMGRSRLYVDRGHGFTEMDSVDLGETGLRHVLDVSLGPRVLGLRFDPAEQAGRFTLREFTIERKSGPLGLLARVVRRCRRAFAWRWESYLERRNRRSAEPAAPHPPLPPALEPYQAWLEVNAWNGRREQELRARLSRLASPPLLSVVMPVYNPPLEFLEKALRSLTRQVYDRWELCVADDASTDPAVRPFLEKWRESDPRVRVTFRPVNGNISRATASAAEMARGEFLVLMDQDDELTPDALGEVADHLREHPDTDLLYSDDDKIDASGRRFAPQFKPDWSPELLLSYMYLSHVLVARRSLFQDVGGMRIGFEGSQDYDFALRASEKARRIGHIPKVLYHWRVLPNSTASSGRAKPASFEAGRRAVQEALDRRGAKAEARQPDWALAAGCGIFSARFPDDGPRVAIVIPTRDKHEILSACVRSIEAKTTYRNYRIVIIDNGSDDPGTLAYLRESPHTVLRIPSPGGRFSFAAVMNEAVRRIDDELVLLLNNDVEVRTPEWLGQMVGTLGLPGVGAVGARLLFPDGRIQHAGIVHGLYHGLAGPAFKLTPAHDLGYLSYAGVLRNYSAVTGACLLTRRDTFLALGGFDERAFAVAYNDVDFCYRLRDSGQRLAYCPTAELTHHEGYSRGHGDDPREPAAFLEKYGGRADPYYSPHLSLDDEKFRVEAATRAPEKLAPLRALMCAFNLNWEGAPYSQFEMTARLKELGVLDPVVYCPEDGPLRKAYEDKGIPVRVLPHPLRGVSSAAEYDRAIREFSRQILEWKADVVYGNTLKSFYAIDAAREAGLPSIWNPRESEPWQTYFNDFSPAVAERALKCFAYPYRVVFVSDATRRGCEALNSRHNFTTVHNGLDFRRIDEARGRWPRDAARAGLEIPRDACVVLLLGTVCERKGQLDLVRAVGRMDPAVWARAVFLIVGDRPGDYSRKVHEAVQVLPPAARAAIRLVPETPEPFRYLAASDLFVCTSRIESFPRVILEAMAFELPIVTTPVFGISEQVREKVNALLYAPEDVADLAAKVGELVGDPQLRRSMGANGTFVLRTLMDFEEMAAAYARVFREAWMTEKGRSCAASSV